MLKRAPSYAKLFAILNRRIALLVENGDTEQARKEIEVLERLVKLKKTFMEFAEKAKARPIVKKTIDTKIEKEKLLKDLEARLNRIGYATNNS